MVDKVLHHIVPWLSSSSINLRGGMRMRGMCSQLPTALLYYLIRVLLSSGLQSICKGCGLWRASTALYLVCISLLERDTHGY